MIIFGTRTKPTSVEKLLGSVCQNCRGSHLNRYTYWSYFHLYWIPVFPYRKSLGTICPSCKAALQGKELSDQLKNAPGSEAESISNPLWMCIGLMLIGLFIYIGEQGSAERREKVLALAKDPHVSDLLVIEVQRLDPPPPLGPGKFAVFEVASVEPSTVSLRVPTVSYKNGLASEKAIEKGMTRHQSYFSESLYPLDRSKLVILADNHVIDRVVRAP